VRSLTTRDWVLRGHKSGHWWLCIKPLHTIGIYCAPIVIKRGARWRSG
jgi:hypothetical protein